MPRIIFLYRMLSFALILVLGMLLVNKADGENLGTVHFSGRKN